MTGRPSYTERTAVLKARLNASLNPQTRPENIIVAWLAKQGEPTMETVATMVEHQIARARAEGYDAGYTEGRAEQ